MERISKIVLCCLIALSCGVGTADADTLKDLLGGLSGGKVGDVVNGLLGKEDFEISELEGTWTITGPAVVFRSDDALQKAGGVAASTVAEEKIRPYYDKLGLNNASVTFDAEGGFSMAIKKLPLKGTVSKKDDGTYSLSLSKSGVASKLGNLGTMDAYIQKSGNSMSVAMDATKLVQVLKLVASKTDISSLSTILELLESYDNVCLGFRMSR